MIKKILPNAILDKSVLQRIAELSKHDRQKAWAMLNKRFHLLIPPVLINEVLVNRGEPRGTKPHIVEAMWDDLLALSDRWLADEIDVSFQELILGSKVTEPSLMAAQIVKHYCELDPTTPGFKRFSQDRSNEVKDRVSKRVALQNEASARRRTWKLPGDNPIEENGSVFFIVEREEDFFERFVHLGTEARTQNPDLWCSILHDTLGEKMKSRYREEGGRIDTALKELTTESLRGFPATWSVLLSKFFYFWGPMVKIRDETGMLRRIIGRNIKGQLGNIHDERYVGMALLCPVLLTCDRDMHRASTCFQTAGLWRGKCYNLAVAPGQRMLDTLSRLGK